MTTLYCASNNGSDKPSMMFSDPKLAYQYAIALDMTVTKKEVPTPKVRL